MTHGRRTLHASRPNQANKHAQHREHTSNNQTHRYDFPSTDHGGNLYTTKIDQIEAIERAEAFLDATLRREECTSTSNDIFAIDLNETMKTMKMIM